MYKYLFVILPLLLGTVTPFLLDPKAREQCLESKYQPPGWVFSVVWPILYLLTGLAGMFAYTNKKWNGALTWWLVVLIGTLVWWPVFTSICAPVFAFVWLLVLACLCAVSVSKLFKVSKTSGWLQLPLTLWLFFASFLAFSAFGLKK